MNSFVFSGEATINFCEIKNTPSQTSSSLCACDATKIENIIGINLELSGRQTSGPLIDFTDHEWGEV